MKITDFHWERFSFLFKTPFRNAGYTYRERQGFYLYIEINFAGTYVGECAPLPGVSEESTGDVALELEQIEESLHNFEFESGKDFVDKIEKLTQTASIRYAFAQIIYAVTEKFSDSKICTIELNSVIPADTKEKMLHNIRKNVDAGFTTIKLKIGSNHPEQEISLIREIKRIYPDVRLRLDANGSLLFEEAVELTSALSNCNVEYIEDPLGTVDEMIFFAEKSFVPVAADIFIKSVADINFFLQNSKISTFIIKPIAFVDILKLRSYNFDKSTKIILSSSFESFVGRLFNYTLASKFSGVHGLATASVLVENITDIPVYEDQPVIKFDVTKTVNWLNQKVLI